MRSVAFNGIFFTSLCLYSEIVERFGGGKKKKSLFPQAEHCVGKHGELTTRNSNGRVLPLNAGTLGAWCHSRSSLPSQQRLCLDCGSLIIGHVLCANATKAHGSSGLMTRGGLWLRLGHHTSRLTASAPSPSLARRGGQI